MGSKGLNTNVDFDIVKLWNSTPLQVSYNLMNLARVKFEV